MSYLLGCRPATGLAALLLVAACGSGGTQPAQLVNPPPTARVTSRPTPARVTTRPTATPKPNYYTPPGWSGGDVNCSDFDTHRHAQAFFDGTGGTRSNDPYGLDSDHDADACESLP